jgi:hypothetical protein
LRQPKYHVFPRDQQRRRAQASAMRERNGALQFLDQKDLANRWLISPRTLEQWRWQGRGPRYLKIGGRVVYRLSDIETFELASVHANTVGPIDQKIDAESADG